MHPYRGSLAELNILRIFRIIYGNIFMTLSDYKFIPSCVSWPGKVET
jgi:hypothetical protein